MNSRNERTTTKENNHDVNQLSYCNYSHSAQLDIKFGIVHEPEQSKCVSYERINKISPEQNSRWPGKNTTAKQSQQQQHKKNKKTKKKTQTNQPKEYIYIHTHIMTEDPNKGSL